MARFYTKADAGAPALYYAANSTVDVRVFGNFKEILKACLVNGYGSGSGAKPAAGWALIHEEDRSLTLRNASGRYVTITSLAVFVGTSTNINDRHFRVYLHNTFTGMTGGVPQGEGVVTGTSPNGALPHTASFYYFGYFTQTSLWTVLADENSFYLCGYGATTSGINSSNIINVGMDGAREPNSLYVGDDNRGNFIAVGGILWAGSSNNNPATAFDHATITTLRNPHTGLLIDTGGAPDVTQVLGLYQGSTRGGQTPYSRDQFSLNPIEWVCGSKVAGALRGGFIDLPSTHVRAFAAIQAWFGGMSTVTCVDYLTPVQLADGHRYMLAPTYISGKLAIITDNPALW
ncbi:hypothetical protein [Ectopseudomonas mendocina]|uniref:hypothetical protein n=1 Tax=Ectopseudomonas mendocina TaxID=300 RepID=UPI003F021D15